MSTAADLPDSHAALMNATYRHQRRIYDASRRFFLLGRDHLIANLDPPAAGSVLDIACGTGRNLALIADKYPGCSLYGLDISSEMLRSAQFRLKSRASLAEADASDFSAENLFGIAKFDRVIFSYSLSMIPDWTNALRVAFGHLAPGGELHVVDFGDQNRLPRWFRAGLRAWLAKFHVQPRASLPEVMRKIAAEADGAFLRRSLFRDYAEYGVLTSSPDPEIVAEAKAGNADGDAWLACST